jgi:hypothetical protein
MATEPEISFAVRELQAQLGYVLYCNNIYNIIYIYIIIIITIIIVIIIIDIIIIIYNYIYK